MPAGIGIIGQLASKFDGGQLAPKLLFGRVLPTMNTAAMQTRSEFLNSTKWFDAAWYQDRFPQARRAPDLMLHYLEEGARAGMGPNQYIDDLQRSCGGDANPAPGMIGALSRLRAEMKLVSASGLFDSAYYLKNNADIAAKGGDPLRHFCQYGWRQLRRPNSSFDVWWYWSCYLDPMREAVNPLVHYILVGHVAGYPTQPPPYRPGPGNVLSGGAGARRICLLAGYDPDGNVDDYVVELALELSRFADVYYLGDCVMRSGQLEKLDPYVAGRWAYRHGTYDFGSWSALANRHVGWSAIEQYDELLLVNDSNYLIGPLAPVFAKMQSKPCDWWGLQATKGMSPTRDIAVNRFKHPIPMGQVRTHLVDLYLDDYIYDFHVGSYFVAFRSPVIRDAGFRRRLTAVCPQRSKAQVVRKYEMGLTQYLIGRQFSFDTFIDDLHPLHPIFTNRQFDLIKQGFPLFKRLLLVSNHYDVPGLAGWQEKLRSVAPDARVDLIERNLQRVADHAKLHRSFAIVEDATGAVSVPVLMGRDDFLEADRESPKFSHWWAFAVDPATGTLSGDERAVFEAVREDPSIKKIVLTRWRKVELDGQNVVVAPLCSPEGQYHLLRAGTVFGGNDPEKLLSCPLLPMPYRLINFGLEPPADPDDGASANGSAATAAIWRPRAKGLPRVDIVLCGNDRLPGDLRAQSDRLQALCADRRLLLLASTPVTDVEATHDRFMTEGVAALHGWLRENKLALGIREYGTGGPHACYDLLRGPNTLDLSERRFPQIEILFRHATALVADTPGCFATFASTGRPAIRLSDESGDATKVVANPGGTGGGPRLGRTFQHLRRLIAALHAAMDPIAPNANLASRPPSAHGEGMEYARAVVEEILQLRRPGSDGVACPAGARDARR